MELGCSRHRPSQIERNPITYRATRTPTMHAGLVRKQLNFRDVFTARYVAARFAVARLSAVPYHEPIEMFRCAA